jgi:hypothetical protein
MTIVAPTYVQNPSIEKFGVIHHEREPTLIQ